jgi:hypothetical protein
MPAYPAIVPVIYIYVSIHGRDQRKPQPAWKHLKTAKPLATTTN